MNFWNRAKPSVGKFVFESTLIIFSVLIAFGINNWWKAQSDRKLRIQVLQEIRSECERNLDILRAHYLPTHREMLAKLESNLAQTGYIEGLVAAGGLRLDQMSDKPMVNQLLQDNAWTTALSAAPHVLNYEERRKISLVYNLQEVSVMKTIHDIIDILFSREFMLPQYAELNLRQLHFRLRELIAQEQYVIKFLEDALESFPAQ